MSFTVMETTAVAEPEPSDAVTVYSVGDCSAAGVPEIAPVDLSNTSPAGRSGVTDHCAALPLYDGILFVILRLTV